jgi:hypothetical protein
MIEELAGKLRIFAENCALSPLRNKPSREALGQGRASD